jgi:hypothetical protein
MLLKHPGPLVEVAAENVVIEPVNVLAHIQRRSRLLDLHRDILALLPRSQEPLGVVMGPTSGKDAVRSAKHGLHLLGLGLEIAVRALDNANGVDPQVALAEGARGAHGVAERGGQRLEGDAGLVLLESCREGHEVVACSPGVREGDVLGFVGGAGLPEPDRGVAFGADVDEARWEAFLLLVGLVALGVRVAVP